MIVYVSINENSIVMTMSLTHWYKNIYHFPFSCRDAFAKQSGKADEKENRKKRSSSTYDSTFDQQLTECFSGHVPDVWAVLKLGFGQTTEIAIEIIE